MSSASEKANLARIRDNQRRSRARRKEYLQELESRLRSCELQGIEASSEIQVAARRVADENRKLRALLVQSGIGDDTIEAFLATDAIGNNAGYANVKAGQPAQVLDNLLNKKKVGCGDGSMPGMNANIGHFSASQRGGSCGSSAGSISTVQSSSWEHIQPRRTSNKAPSGGQFMTPTSTASRASSISYGRNMHPIQSMPTTLSPASNGIPILSREYQPQHLHPQNQNQHHHSHSNAHQQHQHQHQQHPNQPIFDFGDSLSYSNSPDHSQDQQGNIQQQHEYPHISGDTNSCIYATDIITTMAGGNEDDVRADLGCLPGMDCQIDNQLVFNVMDRYSGEGMGL